jgi:hypothetical protein
MNEYNVTIINFLDIIHCLFFDKNTGRFGDWSLPPSGDREYIYWAQQSRCPFT